MRILIINYFSYYNMKECVSIVESIVCKVHTHKNIVHFFKIMCDLCVKERGNHQVSYMQTIVHARERDSLIILSVQIKYDLKKCATCKVNKW